MQYPEELAGNGVLNAEVDEKIDEVVRALRCAVDAKVGLDCSFADREQAALSIGNEAQRCLLEQELQSIVEAQGRELLINEALYREHRPGSRDYASLCGPLRIQRLDLPGFRGQFRAFVFRFLSSDSSSQGDRSWWGEFPSVADFGMIDKRSLCVLRLMVASFVVRRAEIVDRAVPPMGVVPALDEGE